MNLLSVSYLFVAPFRYSTIARLMYCKSYCLGYECLDAFCLYGHQVATPDACRGPSAAWLCFQSGTQIGYSCSCLTALRKARTAFGQEARCRNDAETKWRICSLRCMLMQHPSLGKCQVAALPPRKQCPASNMSKSSTEMFRSWGVRAALRAPQP